MWKELSQFAEDLALICRDYWRTYIIHFFRTVHPVPPIFGLLAFGLYAGNGQLGEIYIRIIESDDWPRLVLGFASIVVIASALFISYIRLTHHRAAALYGSVSNILPDPWLLRTRAMLALVCAGLPFLGLVWGMWRIRTQVDSAAYMVVCILAAVLVLRALWLNRGNQSVGRWVQWAAIALVIAIFAAPTVPSALLLPIAQYLGPLAVVGLQFVAVLAVFAWLSRLNGWIPGAVIAALLAQQCVSLFYAPTPDEEDLQLSNRRTAGTPKGDPEVVGLFEKWLDARQKDIDAYKGADSKRKYPAFIVAAQGGGIYAASAAANLLAALQDDSPSFSRHVFAISGVSGGSVGAAVYSSMLGASPEGDAAESLERPVGGGADPKPDAVKSSYKSQIREVLTKDHLSPVLAVLVPEIAFAMLLDVVDLAELVLPRAILSRSVPSLAAGRRLPGANSSRVGMLESSLACGHLGTAQYRECVATGSNARLRKPMTWQPSSSAPALVLNTTSSESGSIVAFAPFGLKDLREPYVEAFSDQPYDDADPNNPELDPRKPPLITAAVASARFPGVLPPYSLAQEREISNFVDGAYADSSGVATAGAIYKVLRRSATSRGVDLRLILVTGEDDGVVRHRSGSSMWADLLVPFEAFFNVQWGLGSREVVRALNQFADDGEGKGRRVIPLRFPTKFLGWTISVKTNDRIASTIAAKCPDEAERAVRLNPYKAGSRQRLLEVARIENLCSLVRDLKVIKDLLAPPSS